MNRAERRRAEREARKATPEPAASAELPEKEPGRHRWLLYAVHSLTDAQVMAELSTAPDTPATILDASNRVGVIVECADCTKVLGEIVPGSRCEAEAVRNSGLVIP